MKQYPAHQTQEFQELLESYENGSTDLPEKVMVLVKRGYEPAVCMVGLFEMLGLAFPKNLTSAYTHLMQGAEKNLWACQEALSFHPYTKDVRARVWAAANLGGIWSMIRKGLMSENVTEQLQIWKHLCTVQTSWWWKKRRSGLEYADAVGAILRLNSGNQSQAWTTIERLAKRGHLPAALWMAEGLETGEAGRTNLTEAVVLLQKFVLASPWTLDLAGAQGPMDWTMFLHIAESLGNEFAPIMLSYPGLFT